MKRVADYLVEQLVQNNIEHIFMVTGRGILFLTDAVAKNDRIQGISVHHEQTGAFAAYAYAQRKATPGACLVSTGVAATNALTGVLNAWQDNVPVIFISGQNKLNETTYHTGLGIRTYGQQEANIVDIVKPITKYAVMLEDASDIAYELDKAMYLAASGRKGPVWLDIPLDLQNMRVEPNELKRFRTRQEILAPSIADVDYVSRELNTAARPLILIGSGIRSAGAESLVCAFAKKNNIPVVFDAAAVDVFPDENDLSIGTIGSMGGSRAGNFAVQNCDLLISIGCRLTSMQVGEEPGKFAREAKVIVVDIDADEPKKNTVNITKFIHADAKTFLELLSLGNISTNHSIWAEKCKHWKQVFPKCEEWSRNSERVDLYYLAECIGTNLQPGHSLTCDAGLEELIVPAVACKKNGVRCIHPASQGCMGFALGASIGSFYAGSQEVVSIIGDGSMMMNLQELQTISYLHLPIKIFVSNNNGYSVIRRRQRELFRTRTIGTDKCNGVSCADFKKIAAAFEIPYVRVENTSQLKHSVKEVFNMEGPIICEVMAVEEQEYLRNAYARSENKRLVKRSLEDQAPFMDRELFKAEMVVEPINEE